MLHKIRHRFANTDDMERDFLGMKIKMSWKTMTHIVIIAAMEKNRFSSRTSH
jgi:hypothetical protein